MKEHNKKITRTISMAIKVCFLMAMISDAFAVIEFGTGLSLIKNPKAGAAAAARQARETLGSVQAGIVFIWDNYGGSETREIIEAVQTVFPNTPVVGQHENPGLTGYIPYTDQGHGDSTCIAVAAIGGNIEIRIAYVNGVDGLALKMERDSVKLKLSPAPVAVPKAKALVDSLKHIPEKSKVLVLMGCLHDPGCIIFAPILDSLLGYKLPIIGGASGNDALVYVNRKVLSRAIVAVILSGDFNANLGFHNAGREKRTDQVMALAGEAATVKEILGTIPPEYKPKGMIWFNCRRRTDYEWWRPAQSALDAHIDNMKRSVGDLSFWGHVSGNEACNPLSGGPVVGASSLAAFVIFSDMQDRSMIGNNK